MYRISNHKGNTEDTQHVKFKNGFTNKSYVSEATLDIIKGNPDRNSKDDEYSTIEDEHALKEQEYTQIDMVTSNYVELICVNNGASDNYFTLEKPALENVIGPDVKENGKAGQAAFSYELATPVNDGSKTGRKIEDESKDYDHLAHVGLKPNPREQESNDTYAHVNTEVNDNHDKYSHEQGGGYDHTDTFIGVKSGHADDSYEHAGNVQNDNNDNYNHSSIEIGGNSPDYKNPVVDDEDD